MTTAATKYEVEEYLRKHYTPGIFDRMCGGVIRAASVPIGSAPRSRGKREPEEVLFDQRIFNKFNLDALIAGRLMEETEKLLQGVNAEVRESSETLKELKNEVSALTDVIHPALLEQIKEIRSARMALVQEIRESLQSLREIRKFFLESDYATEMERLERFVRLCRELQELKHAGVFDAVCDSAIRMAIKETK